jgi:hypothetical protein
MQKINRKLKMLFFMPFVALVCFSDGFFSKKLNKK